LEHQIAMKVLEGKLAQAMGKGSNNKPKKAVMTTRPKKIGKGALQKPLMSLKRPLAASGPATKSQPQTQRQQARQHHPRSLPPSSAAAVAVSQPSLPSNNQQQQQQQLPPSSKPHRPIRGKRNVRDGSRLASILNRLEQNIQRNEQRGENSAHRFIQNMVNNPQLRGRALVTASKPRTMIHTERLPRDHPLLLQQHQERRRPQHQPYRYIAPAAATSANHRPSLRHGKQKSNLGTLDKNATTPPRNKGERASFSNKGVHHNRGQALGKTTSSNDPPHTTSTGTTTDALTATKKTSRQPQPRMGSLKNHLDRSSQHDKNKHKIDTTADTSVGTATTTRTTGSKSTVPVVSFTRNPTPPQQQDASCPSQEPSLQQQGTTEADEGSYSLYEEYTENDEEATGAGFENSYAEETVYSYSMSQQHLMNGEDSFMEETVRSEVPSKSSLFESWVSYEEEEIVYEEEGDDDQAYDEETIVSYTYSLVDRSRKQHGPKNHGDSIASLQSELDDLRNELKEMEDYEDISLQEDEYGNLVMPMIEYEEEVMESIHEEADEPITLFMKTDDNPTPNSNSNGINLKSNLQHLMEDTAEENDSYENSDSEDGNDNDANDGTANGGEDSSFSLSINGKADASSVGSSDPLQPVEQRQTVKQAHPLEVPVKQNLPSVQESKHLASSVAVKPAKMPDTVYDENEGYHDEDGNWHWYADEGYQDGEGNWHWYENEGYYDNDGYWHWWENEGYYDDDGTWHWYATEKEDAVVDTDEQASGEITAEKEVQLPPELPEPTKTAEKASPFRREPEQLVSTPNPASSKSTKKKVSPRKNELVSTPKPASKKSSKTHISVPPPESPPPKSKPSRKKLLSAPSTQQDKSAKKQPKSQQATKNAEKKSFRRIRRLASRVRSVFGRKRRRNDPEMSDLVAEKEISEMTNGYGAKPNYYKQTEKDKIRLVRETKTKLPAVLPHPDDEVPTRVEFVYDWIMDRYVPRSVPIPVEEQKKIETQLPEKSKEDEVCIEFVYEDETDNVDYGYDVDEQDGRMGSACGSPADGPTFCPMPNEEEDGALATLVKKGRVALPKRQLSQHSQHSVSDSSTTSEEEEEYWGSQIGFDFDPTKLEDDDDVIPLLKNGGPLVPRGNNASAPRNASTSTRRGGRRKSLDDGAIGPELSDSIRDSKVLRHNSMHNMSSNSLKIDEGDEEEDENVEEEAKRREIFREAHKKKGFAEVVQEAASLGRLTRLNEKVVEASGRKAAPKKSRRASVVATNLLDIAWKTTHHGSVCNDIVELGQMYRGNEVITESQHHKNRSSRSFDSAWSGSNDYTSDSDDWDEFGGESDEEGVGESRHRRGKRPSHIDGIVQRAKEQHKANNSKMVEHLQNQNPDEIELPATAPPQAPSIIRRQQNNPRALRRCSIGTIKRTLTEDVIQRHSERQARVETGQVHMKGQCDCPYCYTASPYQTYAYKKAVEKKTGQPATWVRQNGQWSKSAHV